MPVERTRGKLTNLSAFCRPERLLSVHGLPERVNHASEESRPDRDPNRLPSAANCGPCLNSFGGSIHSHTNVLLVEIENFPARPVFEGDHLVKHHGGETFDACDPIADAEDTPDVLNRRLDVMGWPLFESLESLLKRLIEAHQPDSPPFSCVF